ncbi:DUF948 domain-containing protein [Bacillus sp. KH172YL63]|uniref:DUF948 domain-containing protein n=1 Tax=Bacillus sp. KH172YL63 TaxID=2709784 RepID=UPI0013E46F21|nr:DUF948 domain-containing protein [Bacillus sp. KH172YL63]BCB03847.1 hypothetical protein KH172YL63_19800 [Bacillus sp. KH172YL63]
MWIVYVSIAVFVTALVMLGISLVKTMKETKPVINEMNHTVASIQSRMDKLSMEANLLQETQGEIQDDIEFKKTAINETVNEVKKTPKVMMGFLRSMKK